MGIIEVSESIRSMQVRGAGRIARSAAQALREEALSYQGHDLQEFRAVLDRAVANLEASRPTAISLSNGLRASMKGSRSAASVQELRDLVASNAEAFVKRSSQAVEAIGRIGSRRIRDGDTVLTHCNSSAALEVIKTAHASGKDIQVYATESRPWRQGLLTVKDLSKAGVPVTLIIDSAVKWAMKDIDVAVVGADTICSNGALINKVGTSQVAMAAHETRVPFLVAAETYKFSPRTMHGELVEIEERDASEVVEPNALPPGVKVRNPVFDATPPEHIDSLITEIGLIPPYAAFQVIISELGQEALFQE